MKVFIQQVLLMFVVIFVSSMTMIQPSKSNYAKRISNFKGKLDIVNFGSSHGLSFRYGYTKLSGLNMAKASNSIYYDFQNYKYIRRNLRKNSIVIIPVSYFSFGVDENRTDKNRGDINFVDEYYSFQSPQNIYGFSITKYLTIRRSGIHKKIKNWFSSPSIEVAKIKTSTEKNIAQFKMNAKRRAAHHQEIVKPENIERNIRYLSQFILKVIEDGYTPVLVTTPFNREYNKHFDKAKLKRAFHQPLQVVLKKTSAIYLDYSTNSRISSKKKLFENSDHMNLEGKKLFIKLFFDDLVKLKLIAEKDVIFNE